MKILLKLVVGLVALVLVAAAIAFLLPRTYRVQRTIHVSTTADTIYAHVADLRRWKEWGVWFERDPAMKIEYSEKTDTVGGWSEWVSKGDKGKMTLTALRPPTQVGYRLEFPDMGMTSAGLVEIVPDAAGVTVVLSDEGDLGLNPISRWFGLFLDRMIGPDFEAGLAKLKQVAERGS